MLDPNLDCNKIWGVLRRSRCIQIFFLRYKNVLYTPRIREESKIQTVHTLVFCCVCVFSSHSFWTSSSLDVPAGVTQEEGHTGFLIHLLSVVRALIFLARRIQPFLSLVDREVEFCVLTI